MITKVIKSPTWTIENPNLKNSIAPKMVEIAVIKTGNVPIVLVVFNRGCDIILAGKIIQ
jgi:hypothetical protein